MNGTPVFWICLGIVGFLLLWLIVARIIRQRFPFPIPYFMVHVIDNPVRRWVQPLHRTPERLGLRTGMTVLEIGPGSGTYTLAAAKAVGPEGRIVAIDIERRVVQHVQRRIDRLEVMNISVQEGDAQDLKFHDASFDAVYGITVYGEIPDRDKALQEFMRVLRPGGTLAISEFLIDPDSQPLFKVLAECERAGFNFVRKTGNMFHYTLLVEKSVE